MQVICTDGTTFRCESYDLTEYGVVLYGQEKNADAGRYEDDPEQFGFVPHERLWYILPEGIRSTFLENAPPQQPQQHNPPAPPQGQAPPTQQPIPSR